MTAEAESGQESSEEVGVDSGGSGGLSKKCDEKGDKKFDRGRPWECVTPGSSSWGTSGGTRNQPFSYKIA